VIILRERQQVLLCFGKKALERMFYALFSNINAHPIRDRPTPKDDERFRNGLVHEFYSLKALKSSKEVNTSDVEKIKNVQEQNFDIETNKRLKQIVMLDKEKSTGRIN